MAHPLVVFVRERVAEFERARFVERGNTNAQQDAVDRAILESARMILKAHDDGSDSEIGWCPSCWYSTPGSFYGDEDGDEPDDEWHRRVMPCPTLKAYAVRWSYRADYLPQWRPDYRPPRQLKPGREERWWESP